MVGINLMNDSEGAIIVLTILMVCGITLVLNLIIQGIFF